MTGDHGERDGVPAATMSEKTVVISATPGREVSPLQLSPTQTGNPTKLSKRVKVASGVLED